MEQKMEQRYWWKYGDEKTRIDQLNKKCSLIRTRPKLQLEEGLLLCSKPKNG